LAARRVKRWRRRAGFTLIEILIALVITVLGLSAVAAMFVANASGTSYARHATEASVLAEDQLELMLNTPTALLGNGYDRVDEKGVVVTDGGFQRTWDVTWDGDIARITVTVTWTEGDGDRQIIIRTLRAR
jgi:prepilin-type N-terminal cleavage/methylation domain-containing protein